MADNECQVCGYKFLDKDFDAINSVFKCPYCNTTKKLYNSQKDLNRLSLLNNGYDYLTKALFNKASEEFTQYISNYPDNKSDSDVVLGNALANCSLANCLNYKKDKMITTSYNNDLTKIIKSKAFNDIKELNDKIYDNVIKLYQSNERKYDDSIMLISLDESKIIDVSSKLEEYKTILYIDITKDDIESVVYKNIVDSFGLVVYVDDERLLTNAYFLSIYYRFINHGKRVILIADEDVNIPKMFQDVLDFKNNNLIDEIISILNTKQSIRQQDDDKYIAINGKITEFVSNDKISIKSNIYSIASRSGYEKDLTEIVVTTTGTFEVEEKAFTGSTIELFRVQSKTCTISFGIDAFSKCKSLKSVIFDNTSIKLSVGLFSGCESLRSIKLKDKEILELPSHIFDEAKNLSNVELPKSLKLISKYAFKNTKISEIDIYSGVKIEKYAFQNVDDLTINVIPGNNSYEGIIIDEDSLPDNTKVIFKGKEFKKAYKTLKKQFSNLIVQLEK